MTLKDLISNSPVINPYAGLIRFRTNGALVVHLKANTGEPKLKPYTILRLRIVFLAVLIHKRCNEFNISKDIVRLFRCWVGVYLVDRAIK